MTKPRLPLVTPSTVFGPVTRGNPPQRRPNAASRDREYLKKEEVEKLIAAAGKSRYGLRDQTLVLIAYRHGLRVSELVSLRWDSIDFRQGQIHIARVKGSAASVHPLTGRELRTLRKLQREQDPALPFVFTSERGAPFATGGFRTLIARLGEAAGLTFRLRHGCGYQLANQGVDTRSLQAYLGHKNIQHTVRYTELAPTRFKDFWRD